MNAFLPLKGFVVGLGLVCLLNQSSIAGELSPPSSDNALFQLAIPQEAIHFGGTGAPGESGQDKEEPEEIPPGDYTWRERYVAEPTLENDIFIGEVEGNTKIASCKPQVKAEIFKSFKKDLLKYAQNTVETTEGKIVTFIYDTTFSNGTTAKWKTVVESLSNGFASTTETLKFNGKGNMEMVKALSLNVTLTIQDSIISGKAQFKTTLEKPWAIPSSIFFRMAKSENIKQFKPRFDKALTYVGHPLCWAKKSLPAN